MICNTGVYAALVALALSAVACASPTDEGGADVTGSSQDVVARASFKTAPSPEGGLSFKLVAGNGEVLLTSRPFATAAELESAIETAVAHGNDPRHFAVVTADSGGFVFHLKTPAGEVLATSDPYGSRASAERGADTVRALIRIEQQAQVAPVQP